MSAVTTGASASLEGQIHTALLSYCRGIDRLDPDAVRAAFHPGADLIDYGPDSMSIEAFVDYALSSLEERFTATQHRISNTTIEFDDGRPDSGTASVETYVLAFHVQADRDGGPDRLHTFNGRYIDRFEARDGRWLIATRTLRVDWSRVETIERSMGGSWVPSGRADRPDPIYSPD